MRGTGQLPIPPALRRMVQVVRRPRIAVPLLTILVLGSLGALLRWLVGNWLVVVVVLLALALLVLVGALVWMLLARERSEREERGVDDEEAVAEQRAREARREDERRLETRFEEGLAELRRSRLGRDAAEALPWYLVIGETGAGKSAAVQACGLDTPAEHARPPASGPTETIDWWFTNEAVFLDTAGRFLDSSAEADREAWRRLLQLVRRARPRLPLNGVVVAVSAPALLERPPRELEESARALRRRLNDVHDALGLELPIYLAITQGDRVEGFLELSRALPAPRLDEAFGWTNGERQRADAGDAVARGLAGLRDRLDRLLPEMILREADPVARRRLFVLPQELETLGEALERFARRVFAPTVYEETPFLRGVYLTSARAEGQTVSAVLRRLGHAWAPHHVEPAAPGRPLFLRDLFREVVVGDEGLALPASRLGPRARRLALGTAGAAALLAAGVWLAAFGTVWSSLGRLEDEARPVLVASPGLAAVDDLREAIEEETGRAWVRWSGLGGPLEHGAERARRSFRWAFGRELEEPTKARLLGAARGRDDPKALEAVAALARDVSWLASRAELPDDARPSLEGWSPVGRNPDDEEAFRKGYDAFVRWLPEIALQERLERERDALAAVAGRLLDLRRLERWSDRRGEGRFAVRYRDAGLPPPPEGVRPGIPRAYTRTTWDSLVRVLIAGVERTGGAPASEVDAFRRGYVTRFDTSWRRYLIDVPTPPRPDPSVEESPYLTFLAQIDRNTRAELPRPGGTPAWIEALREVRRDARGAEEAAGAASAAGAAAAETTEETLRGGEGSGAASEAARAAAEGEPPPWERYRAALDQVAADVAAATVRPGDALDVARDVAERDDTAFHRALERIRSLVPRGGDAQATAALRRVLAMPVLDGFSAVLEKAAEAAEQRFESRIASRFGEDLTEAELEELYAPERGALSRFRSEVLGPFYAEGRSRPVLEDRALPLGEHFLDWMEGAETVQRTLFPGVGDQPEVAVRLEGVPSRVVGSSSFYVTRRDLRLTCAQGTESFVYREGSGSHTFPWTPDCQELELRVWIREGSGAETELRPPRSWSGPLAFPGFFHEADRAGEAHFEWRIPHPRRDAEIVVGYRLRSGEPILEIAHRAPPESVRR